MIEQLVSLLKNCERSDNKPLALHEPSFPGNEYLYIKQCLDEQMVSSIGSFVTRFEQKLSQLTQAKYTVATVNGTAALHTCLLIAGVTPNSEVLTSPLSFVATSNCISYCHAFPNFVDIDDTLNIDPDRLKKYLDKIGQYRNGVLTNKRSNRPIKALIVTHIFGHPADMDRLQEVCQQFDLTLLEDAAQGLGSTYKGKPVGHRGLAGAVSFNGNKIITTGGGGAILTNHKDVAERAKHLTTTGKISHPWQYRHDCIAYNYRMPNLNAALGLAQLERFPTILKMKRKLAEFYLDNFKTDEAVFLAEPKYAHSNYWLNTLLLNPAITNQRNKIIEQLAAQQIICRPAWDLHHTLPMYEHCERDQLKVAELLTPRIINLPSSAELINYIEPSFIATRSAEIE